MASLDTRPSSISLGGNSVREEQQPPRPQKKTDVDGLVQRYKAQRHAEGDSDSDNEGRKPAKPFVDWLSFNVFMALLVVADALLMGLGADAVKETRDLFYILEVVLCLVFLVELLVRLLFFRSRLMGVWRSEAPIRALARLFESSRDKVVTAVDIGAVLLSSLAVVLGGRRSVLRFAVLLRLCRALLLLRHVRWLEALHLDRMWLVVHGLMEAMKTLLWICLIMACFLYICAVFTTQMVGHNDELYDSYFRVGAWDHEEFFGTVPLSMLTLLQVLTFDGWSDGVARHVAAKQPAMTLFFALFIGVVAWGLLSLFVSVIIEGVIDAAKKEAERADRAKTSERQKVFAELRDVFEIADADESGMLTLEEMAVALGKTEIYNKLKMIDFPVDDPEKIFMLLDYDESGELSIEEFITGCVRMRGNANSKDLLVAQVAVDTMKKRYDAFESELAVTRDKVLRLQQTARSLISHGEHVFLDTGEYRRRHAEMSGCAASLPRITTGDITAVPWEDPASFLSCGTQLTVPGTPMN